MFFDKLGSGGAGMGPGMGAGASAFTSPGMNPQSLAALMAMFGGGGGGGGGMMGGPQLPMPPARQGGGPVMPGIPAVQGPQAAPVTPMPAAGAQPQGNLMQMLSKLDPAQLQALLAQLGMGGGGMMPGMGGGAGPGGGTGGLY